MARVRASRAGGVVTTRLMAPLAAALLACSGGGSGDSKGTSAPSLSFLSLTPQSAGLNDGGGTVTLSFTVQVADPDADVARIVVTFRDAGGQQLGQVAGDVTNPPGETSGMLGGDLRVSTASVMTYTIEFQAFDSGRRGSNVLQGTFDVTPGNPVPTIASLSPASAQAGGPALTLTVSGSGFVPGATVFFDAYPRTTTYVDGNTLRADVPPYDLSYPRTVLVLVSNPSPGGGTSAAVAFVVEPPPPSPAPTLTSIAPTSVASGSSDLVLTVTGSGFVPSSYVQWNYASISTTFVDAGTLRATVPSSWLAAPQTAAIRVYTPTPGGGTSAPITFTVTRPSQPGVTLVSLLANDLAWDPYQRKIYLSVPSLSPLNPNTVTVLDPFTGELGGAVYVGSEPDRLAISDDGRFLYVGLRGASFVSRLALPALSPDLEIPLTSDPPGGPYYAGDLQVAPGSPRTLAVSLSVPGAVPSAIGTLVIYDDATARPTRASGLTSMGGMLDSLQWGASAGELYAASTQVQGGNLHTFVVDGSGVTLENAFPYPYSFFGRAIHFDAGTGLVYGDDGRAIDPATGLVDGTYPVTGLYTPWMVPDSALGTAFFAGSDYSVSGATLRAFDLTRYVPTRSTSVAFVSDLKRRLVRWGPDGLAFLTGSDVVLLAGSFVLPVSPTANPAPELTSVSPSSAPAGGSNLTLTVTGSGFVPGSSVRWNGSERTTRFVSESALVAYVPASDLAAAASADITVASPVPGGGTSGAVPFTVAP